jgi:hypothetical protein
LERVRHAQEYTTLANGKHFDFLFNPGSEKADKGLVGRVFSYLFVLGALAIGGYLTLKAAQDTGPTSPSAQQAEDAAHQVSSSINLQQATPVLEAWFNETGTYVGAQTQLPPSFGVTLVRADKFSFCIQAGAGPNVQHMNGPNENAPIAGPC